MVDIEGTIKLKSVAIDSPIVANPSVVTIFKDFPFGFEAALKIEKETLDIVLAEISNENVSIIIQYNSNTMFLLTTIAAEPPIVNSIFVLYDRNIVLYFDILVILLRGSFFMCLGFIGWVGYL
jgi:hypothetical protein